MIQCCGVCTLQEQKLQQIAVATAEVERQKADLQATVIEPTKADCYKIEKDAEARAYVFNTPVLIITCRTPAQLRAYGSPREPTTLCRRSMQSDARRRRAQFCLIACVSLRA